MQKKNRWYTAFQATGIGEKEPRDLIRTVQELLGHSDLCMVYAHVMNRELIVCRHFLKATHAELLETEAAIQRATHKHNEFLKALELPALP